MRIYVSRVNESWIVNRFRNEWYKSNKKISTKNIYFSEVVWIIAPWSIKPKALNKLNNKKVLCTVHHIENLNQESLEIKKIKEIDEYVDEYHTISQKSYVQLRSLTNKKIHLIPFWVDNSKWYELKNKNILREKFGLTSKDFLIGSFQRDTEGHDLISPKLIKGPDIFLDIVKRMVEEYPNLKVILTGKRRNYLINEFEKNNINYKYFEMVNIPTLNELYNILDLYIVSSRIEGGPQSIMECSAAKVPIISTDVGLASEILSPESIFKAGEDYKAKPNIDYQYNMVTKYFIPEGMKQYEKMFQNLNES